MGDSVLFRSLRLCHKTDLVRDRGSGQRRDLEMVNSKSSHPGGSAGGNDGSCPEGKVQPAPDQRRGIGNNGQSTSAGPAASGEEKPPWADPEPLPVFRLIQIIPGWKRFCPGVFFCLRNPLWLLSFAYRNSFWKLSFI